MKRAFFYEEGMATIKVYDGPKYEAATGNRRKDSNCLATFAPDGCFDIFQQGLVAGGHTLQDMQGEFLIHPPTPCQDYGRCNCISDCKTGYTMESKRPVQGPMPGYAAPGEN